MKQDDFKRRYIIKLSSSIGIATLNAIIQLILPRAFTVEQYGYYTYNLNVFAILIIGLFVLFPLSFVEEVFAGQTFFIVLLGLEVALVMKFQNDIVGIYDAMALSRMPAICQIIMKVILCAYVLFFYLLGKLNLEIFYVGQLLLIGLMSALLLALILRFQKKKYPIAINKGFRKYFIEYEQFCRPLVIASVVAQVINIVMNWALMKWSGTTEQALFGVAWQLNTLVSFVFSPYAELSKREYAIVSSDEEQIRKLYDKSLRLMMWITSYFSLFIGFCANWLLPIVYGDEYNNATGTTLLIMLYTVYQAAGQMNGSLMIATERTKLNAVLAMMGQILTLILIFIFQIPNAIWPNGLGAIGIAIVYALGNFISTCIGMICISKAIKLDISKPFGVYIVPVVFCSLFAFVLNRGLDTVWIGESIVDHCLKILLAGIIYSVAIAIIAINKPEWIGISSASMNGMMDRLKATMRWRRR